MSRLGDLFRPAAHVLRLPDDQIRELYPKFRWRILESTFIGYATFYFVRNNLPVVSKEMGQALHYSKGQIGDLLALTAIAYGIGKFVLGSLERPQQSSLFHAGRPAGDGVVQFRSSEPSAAILCTWRFGR